MMMTMKCKHCDREAVVLGLCQEHWMRWWTGNEPDDEVQLTPEASEAFYQEVKEVLQG